MLYFLFDINCMINSNLWSLWGGFCLSGIREGNDEQQLLKKVLPPHSVLLHYLPLRFLEVIYLSICSELAESVRSFGTST